MKTRILPIAAVAGLLIGSTAIVQAQSRAGMGEGASRASPGHEMKHPGGTGAREGGGPGQSRLAPGHSPETTGAGDRDDYNTGSGGRSDDDDRARHDTDGLMMDDPRGGIDKE
jgi:hypothetical protein